ncbi:MAG: ABC transporter substrate-binding protein [Chitinophagaceae bacterium]|nr:ABC transporter substrate-binding protein [Chitinophagaceae bacterium]
MMQPLRVALDWTINTNHSPLIVAQQQGWYAQAGLQVQLQHAGQDDYALTPAKKLELGLADIAVCPVESILSFRVKQQPFDMRAIAAIFQTDLSCIVTLASSGLHRPAMLAGQRYASYRARYEDAIVQQMLAADGATAPAHIVYPPKLGIWNTLLSGQAEATWVFDNWEGEQARRQGIDLHRFTLQQYGIPYGYSPVLVASQHSIATQSQVLRQFLAATARGAAFAAAQPEATARLLQPHVPAADADLPFLTASARYCAPHYGQPWGHMQPQRIQPYLQWLHHRGLEPRLFAPEEVATHELLPA